MSPLFSIRSYVQKHEYIKVLYYNKPFLFLFLSGIISRIGDFLTIIAISSKLEEETQGTKYNGLTLSMLVVALVLPSIIFSPSAGVVADLMDKRLVMLFTDFARAAIVLLFLVTQSSTVLILLVLFVCEMFSAFFNPSREGLLPSIVPEKDLDVANALDALMWLSCSFVGSTLGGLIMLLAGSTVCYILDCFTYLLSAVCVVLLILAMKKAKNDGMQELDDEEMDMGIEDNSSIGESVTHDAPIKGIDAEIASRPSVEEPVLSDSPDSEVHEELIFSDVELDLPADVTVEKPLMGSSLGGKIKYHIRTLPSHALNQISGYIYGIVFLLTNPFLLTVGLAKAHQSSIWGTLDIFIIIHSSGRFRMLDNPAVFMSVTRAFMGLSSGISPVLLERIIKPTSMLAMRRTLSFSWILMSFGMLITYLSSFFGYYVGVVLFVGGSAILAYGGGMVWVYSTIILQRTSPENYVGRVLAFDMGFAAAGFECCSAVLVGLIIDFTSVSKDMILCVLMICTFATTVFWLLHYAHYRKMSDTYEPVWMFSPMRFSGLSESEKQNLRKELQAKKGINIENWTTNPELDHLSEIVTKDSNAPEMAPSDATPVDELQGHDTK